VVVTLGTPWLSLAAPCRIVGVLDEPDSWGFAYGTLPGHPEQGEESFVVSIGGDDVVRFRITAFSRPGEWIARLAGPSRAGGADGRNEWLPEGPTTIRNTNLSDCPATMGLWLCLAEEHVVACR